MIIESEHSLVMCTIKWLILGPDISISCDQFWWQRLTKGVRLFIIFMGEFEKSHSLCSENICKKVLLTSRPWVTAMLDLLVQLFYIILIDQVLSARPAMKPQSKSYSLTSYLVTGFHGFPLHYQLIKGEGGSQWVLVSKISTWTDPLQWNLQ